MKRFLLLTLLLAQLSLSDLYGANEAQEDNACDENSSLEFIQTLKIPTPSGVVELSFHSLRDDIQSFSYNFEDEFKLLNSVYFSHLEELEPNLPSVIASNSLNQEYKSTFLIVKDPVSGNTVAQLSYGITDNKEGFKDFTINSIWVEEPYRRIGISKLLLKMCEKLATNSKCDFMSSSFSSVFPEAHSAFVKAGYSYKESPAPCNQTVKHYFMYKILSQKGKKLFSK